MSEGWTDPAKVKDPRAQVDKIRTELDVSQAEATVLKTKNELFRQWKNAFKPTVMERYARMENLVNARKKSIDEYRNWLKPYLARFKMMKEKMETVSPADELSNAYMTPGFGQSQASTGVKLWLWKPFVPAELRKAELGPLKEPHGFVIDPYDDLVKEWHKKINDHWGTDITEKEVRDLLKNEWTQSKPGIKAFPEMDPHYLYYVFFEVTYLLNLVKTPPPEAMETDNVMFYPFRGWFMSQNAVLVHLIELEARKRAFEAYVNQMLGVKEEEEKILKRVEAEFKPKPPEKRFTAPKGFTKIASFGGAVNKHASKLASLYVKRGPYEPVFYERVSKLMARGMGGYYGQQMGHIQKLMGVQ
jgi:hypothetical protein